MKLTEFTQLLAGISGPMNATQFAKLLEQMDEPPRPHPFSLIRQKIDEGATNPPSEEVLAARVAWFEFGLRIFREEFALRYIAMGEREEVIPNVPVEGPSHLPLTFASMLEHLNPDYLGIRECMEFATAIEDLLVRLLHALKQDYVQKAWAPHLTTLRANMGMWQTGPAPDQPTEPDRPAA